MKRNSEYGKLITIEGISGMGKTYYFNKLKQINKDNKRVLFNDEINDQEHDEINKKIFEILCRKKSRFFDNGNPVMETLLIAAKQVYDEKEFVLPSIQNGINVISDRGFDTVCILEALIYSYRFNVGSKREIKKFYKLLKQVCLVPDHTILMIGNYKNSIIRAEKRDGKKYKKSEKKLLYDSAYWFEKIANKNKKRFTIINVDQENEEDIIRKINSIISK